MNSPLIVAFLCILSLTSCIGIKKSTTLSKESPLSLENSQSESSHPKAYCPAATRYFDLLHTRLEVSFDWPNSQMQGNATLVLHPYFYPTNQLVLNAQEYDIHELSLVIKDEKKKLNYTYDKKRIQITLDKEYNQNDTLKINIVYTANPNKVDTKGSDAITDRKGLYFINADGKDPNKPQQIWTQGETEASSCWFPTIDSPNERMTQEIYITVDKKYTTLSNGLLIYTKENPDGTRTDYWKQTLPSAPYLTMLAVGEFSIVKDSWRDLEVNYYVEPDFAQYAKLIFGNTPEMLEYYSKKLGVDYPWEKYSQIIVRDYISGAMENTGAVVHGEFLQVNDRKHLDENHEDVIAHELFHHWFGNMVTCESWANIPLNESFATYGEYLWMEQKYGKDEADCHLQQDLFAYLREAREKRVPLVRYDFEDREDIFDAHTYQKGCRILHMLRNYVGDEAFFKALNLYLIQNKYKSVEVDHLRLAFEEVTGEDLNWFFDQWFFNSGHPALSITYMYDEINKDETITIHQTQDTKKYPLYKLPVDIDIYANGKVERQHVIIDEAEEFFSFPVSSKPDLVNVDANKMLLATKQDDKKASEWIFQYYNAPLYMDRYEALYILSEHLGIDSLSEKVILSALNDKFWNIRWLAVDYCTYLLANHKEEIKNKLSDMALNDAKSAVRMNAMLQLQSLFPKDSELKTVYEKGIKDKSYNVCMVSLDGLAAIDSLEGLRLAIEIEKENDPNYDAGIGKIYSQYADSTAHHFFQKALKRKSSHGDEMNLLSFYSAFLKRQTNNVIIDEGVKILEDVARTSSTWWIKLYGYYGISDIQIELAQKESLLNERLSKLRKNKKTPSDTITAVSGEIEKVSRQREKLEGILASIREAETDEKMKAYYGDSQ
jgi:aminopeptidase N